MNPKNILKMIGKKYGKLTITEFSHMKNGNSYWKCLCDCNNTKVLAAYHLKSGDTASCGCLKVYKHGREETGLKTLYRTYKKNSKRYGREFNVSLEEFKEITSKNCHYCGIEPMCIAKSVCKDSKKLEHTTYKYNGIDRINSNKGYERDNIVPCCKWCNIAKSNRSEKEFKEHIFQMYKFFIRGNNVT